MRIAVINLQSGIGVTKGYREYFTSGWKYVLPHSVKPVVAAGKMLANEKVDIALTTELEERGLRSRFYPQSKILEEYSGLLHFRFFSTRRLDPLVNEGNAIFSAYDIHHSHAHTLTAGTIPRVLGEAQIQIAERPVHVFVAHLGLRNVFRARQIQMIRRIMLERNEPVILGGDFNERNHEAFEILRAGHFAHLSTLPTHPSWAPKHPLSVLFLSQHFTKPRAYIPDGPRFSDHLPLVVETELT